MENKVTLSDTELIEAVNSWVSKLNNTGGSVWKLSVPVNFNEDPDMLITELVNRYKQCVIAKSMTKPATNETDTI